MQKEFKITTKVDNDVRCAALGELNFGDIEISGNVSGDVKTTSGDITADGISGDARSMSGDVNIKQKTKTVIKEVIKESSEKQNNEIA